MQREKLNFKQNPSTPITYTNTKIFVNFYQFVVLDPLMLWTYLCHDYKHQTNLKKDNGFDNHKKTKKQKKKGQRFW